MLQVQQTRVLYFMLKMYRRIEQQAGFIEFSQLHFDEARDLFVQGHLDAREVITFYHARSTDSVV